MRLRRIATNLSLVAVSVLLGLGLLEAGVRMFLGDQMILFPRYHASAHYGDYTIRRLRPNSRFWHTSADGSWEFRTNAQGFRADRDYAVEKPEGRLRVLVLGDSHTEGFEVRQDSVFSAVAERYLKAQGLDAEVLNTGVSGFGTAEELVFLENEGFKYRPNVVVLGFFGNDFNDNMKEGLFVLDDGRPVVRSHEFAPGVGLLDAINSVGALRWLSENSYLYSFALNAAWVGAKTYVTSTSAQKVYDEYAMPNEAPGAGAKALAVKLLERMRDFCRARGIALIVADLPLPSLPGPFHDFRSSIPADLTAAFRETSDVLLSSDDVLGKYRGAAEFHVPHGHHHISEFTHAIYGTAIGETIMARFSGRQTFAVGRSAR